MKNPITFYDKNGNEIRTGMVVRVSNSYFKSDNGTWVVEHSPGDPCWCGNDLSLRKVRKDGKMSATKYNICFWPLVAVVSDREKTAAANEWNRDHAQIEIVEPKTTEFIRAHFADEAAEAIAEAEKYERYWGASESTEALRDRAALYRRIAETVTA